ncbi:hypothetical protein ABNQ39_00150 (plasmid) [Azospirillum sp. A26]|uniref:hypothetical protein n=1 Tax=Azospirillum sp. A26 TaxID=3160607 RepID=UPI00366F0B8B
MANVSAPLGFKPERRLDGAAWTGAVASYRIASGYSTSIYNGDVVKLINTGYLNRAGAGDQMRGIFIGCEYTNAAGQRIKSPYWPASVTTLASQDVTAFVIDDPNMVFEAQMNAAATIPADLGANFNIVATAGSAATGLSAEQLDYSTLTTSAAQFRLIEVVSRPDNDPTSAYAKVLVAPALHDFRVNTGI